MPTGESDQSRCWGCSGKWGIPGTQEREVFRTGGTGILPVLRAKALVRRQCHPPPLLPDHFTPFTLLGVPGTPQEDRKNLFESGNRLTCLGLFTDKRFPYPTSHTKRASSCYASFRFIYQMGSRGAVLGTRRRETGHWGQG